MNPLKTRLSAYRKTLNFSGIERELSIQKGTLKNWFTQNSEPSEADQHKVKKYLKSLGRNI